MKIKTYTARDMRTVLRMVRDEQGPDAVMLSTRHLPEGVEVTVAVDPEAALALPSALVWLKSPAASSAVGTRDWRAFCGTSCSCHSCEKKKNAFCRDGSSGSPTV